MDTTIEYHDRILECRDCGTEFLWNAGEQQFYADRQLSQPARCRRCRQANRIARGEVVSPPRDRE